MNLKKNKLVATLALSAAFILSGLTLQAASSEEEHTAEWYLDQARPYMMLSCESAWDLVGQDVVLWHAFGVTHVPRLEDFPVMPCEITGFSLKPDNFFEGNPAIDLPPETNAASKLAKGCCETTS